ncbi:MAG: glycosyltransferase [Lentisphaeria bacterium]|nr:glycosyltransferase [Lentisphaeria bacterium]
MKITIVTVSFNSAATIRDTFNSLLAQSYEDYEYIVVDGLSKDNTVDIIREYEPKFNGRMRWISEKDSGLYDAMNKGIKMATGEVVGILNSDDFYHRPDSLALVAEAFRQEETDAVYSDVVFVNPDNLGKIVRYFSSASFTPAKFRFGFMPAHPTFFTKKKFFEEYGYYKTDYHISADYELLVRFLYKFHMKTKYIPVDFMTMRMGGKSSASWRSRWILTYECIRAAKSNGLYTNLFLLLLKYPYKIFEYIGKGK